MTTKLLKQRIKNALYQPYGFRDQPLNWDSKLLTKSQDKIKDFLWDRFNTIMDEVEYYSCMVLLYHTIPNKELLIEFKESSQYKRYWSIDVEKTIVETPKISTETPISFKINEIGTVNVIGE